MDLSKRTQYNCIIHLIISSQHPRKSFKSGFTIMQRKSWEWVKKSDKWGKIPSKWRRARLRENVPKVYFRAYNFTAFSK